MPPPNELYERLRNQAMNQRMRVHVDDVSHEPVHIFFGAAVLLVGAVVLFYVLCTNSSAEEFLGVKGSSGNLLKGLFQLASLQLFFLSLTVFYKAFLMAFLQTEPDDFIGRVVAALEKHLNPKKDDDKNISSATSDARSMLWVSLVLAITVNISISISTFIDRWDPSTQFTSLINKTNNLIETQTTSYQAMEKTLVDRITASDERLRVLESQVLQQNKAHAAALESISKVTSALDHSIKNFDGVSVYNSSHGVEESSEGTDLKIDNRITVNNPDNKKEIRDVTKKSEEAVNISSATKQALLDNVTNLLCKDHEGIASYFIGLFSKDERIQRELCETHKNETENLKHLGALDWKFSENN